MIVVCRLLRGLVVASYNYNKKYSGNLQHNISYQILSAKVKDSLCQHTLVLFSIGPIFNVFGNVTKRTDRPLDTCQHHRFTILRSFYHDSRSTTGTTNSSYKTLVNNLLTQIPLPNRNELLLFESYAYPVLHSTCMTLMKMKMNQIQMKIEKN